MSIPASRLSSVAPSVIGAGGTGVILNGLFLSQSQELLYSAAPIGFSSAAAVSSFFGATSSEAAAAAFYFGGYDGSSIKPSTLYFALYNTGAGWGYLLGGVSPFSLATMKTINGTLTVVVNGNTYTTGAINLSSATSYSQIASMVTAALTAANAMTLMGYDSVRNVFYIRTLTAGVALTSVSDTGSVLNTLGLTSALGAVLLPPTPAMTPASCMAGIVALQQNFASFSTVFEPVTSDCILFAQWSAQQGDRFCYVPVDTDTTPTASGDTTSLGYMLSQMSIDGVAGPMWAPTLPQAVNLAAFVMGYAASLNFNQTNGRATAAYRSGGGMTATVTSDAVAQNLLASGYNFYGAYATASQGFTFLQPGSMPGEWAWLDSYYNQIWLNSQFQTNNLLLMKQVGSIPYNAAGYAMISAANQDTVNQALRFGAIRRNVALSASQAAEIDADAGFTISTTVASQGYAWVITDPGATARVQRSSPYVAFFYTDGGSVQKIAMSSVEVM